MNKSTDEEQDKPFIYVNGKLTYCTLEQMIEQYEQVYKQTVQNRSDFVPWLAHLIDLLLIQNHEYAEEFKLAVHWLDKMLQEDKNQRIEQLEQTLHECEEGNIA